MAVRQALQRQPLGGERVGIGLDAHRRPAARPETVTRPTPATWLSFWAMRVSAMSSTWVSGRVVEVSASVMIGASAGFTLA